RAAQPYTLGGYMCHSLVQIALGFLAVVAGCNADEGGSDGPPPSSSPDLTQPCGDGGLQTGTPVTAPAQGAAMAAGDIDGDGNQDVLLVTSEGTVAAMLGTNPGTLAMPQTLQANVGTGCTAIGVGNFDDDEANMQGGDKLDIVVACDNNGNAAVRVLL